MNRAPEFRLGLESCLQDPPTILEDAAIGLLMNRASVDDSLQLALDGFTQTFPNQLTAIFTPQHGLWGDAQANMVETASSLHPRLQIPVHSLYSDLRRPTTEMLDPIDCLVVDLQDVGTRVYTFIWTLLECMQACAEVDIPMLILDRPNPLGGQIIEGPLLEDGFQSFVGGACIPMRHGLTIGEIARLLQSELQIDVPISVVPLQGWTPSMTHDQLGRHWLPPSPNLPTLDAAKVYPGQVLLEGTNLSEGRGTTLPFQVVGAPFIEPETLCDEMLQLELAGVHFLPTLFVPTFDKWQQETCGGVSIHVTDTATFRSFDMTVALLSIVAHRWHQYFQWLEPPYEYETVKPPIDIIFGSDRLRSSLGTCDLRVDSQQWSERTHGIQLYEPSPSRFKT